AVSEHVGAYTHHGHVDVFPAVQVPDAAALRLAEIGRPLLRKEHLGPLRHEHVPSGNHTFGSLPESLSRRHTRPFIAYQMAVGCEQRRAALEKRQRLGPGEVSTRVEMFKYCLHDLEVRRLVDGAAFRGDIGRVTEVQRPESSGFSDVGGDVLAITRKAR